MSGDPRIASLFSAEAKEHWRAVAESADRDLAIVRAEHAVHEFQVVAAGQEAAALLGFPLAAALLVAAVIYGEDMRTRKAAVSVLLEFLQAEVERAA